MTIEMWPIGKPIQYAKNARKIPQRAVDKVAASIREFSWRQPIVVDPEGIIIVGHTRLLAAKKLEQTEVPVHVATGLTATQIKAYRLMDNRSHEEAAWNFDLVTEELAALKVENFPLDLTGFDPGELDLESKPKATERPAEDGKRKIQVELTERQVFWMLYLLEAASEPPRARTSYQALMRKLNGIEAA